MPYYDDDNEDNYLEITRLGGEHYRVCTKCYEAYNSKHIDHLVCKTRTIKPQPVAKKPKNFVGKQGLAERLDFFGIVKRICFTFGRL